MNRALAYIAMCFGSAALAQQTWSYPVWTNPDPTIGPKGAWIRDAGVYSAYTNSNAHRFGAAGLEASLAVPVAGNIWTGSYLEDDGCIAGLLKQNGSTALPGFYKCTAAPVVNIALPDNTYQGRVFRETRNDGGFLLLRNASFNEVVFYAAPGQVGAAGGWSLSALGPVLCNSLSVTSTGADDWGLYPCGSTPVVMKGASGLTFDSPHTAGTTGSLAAIGPGAVRVLQVGGDAGVWITFDGGYSDAGTFGVSPVPAHTMVGVELIQSGGDKYGAGFAFLLGSGAVPNVWTAIPNPDEIGVHWRPSSNAPTAPSTGVWDKVTCLDETFCVLTSSTSVNGTNLATYTNTSVPSVERPQFAILEGTAGTFGLDAGDPDGEAVFVTWEVKDGGGLLQSLPSRINDDGTQVSVMAAPPILLCGKLSDDVLVDAVVSDGFAPHVVRDGGYIRVTHVVHPMRIQNDTIFVNPGDGPQVRRYVPDAGAGVCPPSVVAWSEGTIQAPPIYFDAGIVASNQVEIRFDPPAAACSPTSLSDIYKVAVGDAVLPGAGGEATITFVVSPAGSVAIDTVDADFKVTCGQTAQTTATVGVDVNAGHCPNIAVSWASASGPQIVAVSNQNPATLETVSSNFDALVGATIGLSITAAVPDGGVLFPSVTRTEPFVIGTDKFVSATRRVTPAIGNESGLVNVEITLHNLHDDPVCGVTGVQWRESLSSLTYVDGSAAMVGGSVAATLSAGELIFDGIALGADASVTLRYAGRPQLLGQPSLSGVAWKGQAPISAAAGLPTGQSTCGCDAGSGAATVFVAALAMLRRRRRRR